jgi:hypothetical protein
MKKCSGEPYNPLILDTNKKESLRQILSAHKEEFIDYIHTLGLHVEHTENLINSQSKSTIILTLRTRCFKVDFNDNFAKISPLK